MKFRKDYLPRFIYPRDRYRMPHNMACDGIAGTSLVLKVNFLKSFFSSSRRVSHDHLSCTTTNARKMHRDRVLQPRVMQ